MAETYPIAEQIARIIAAAVSTVTVANGYQYDLALQEDGTRCDRVKSVGGYDRTPPGQYAAQLISVPPARNPEGDQEGSPPRLRWRQEFRVDLIYRPPDKASTPIETVLTRLWADCVQAVMADPQMGALAETTDVGEPSFEAAVETNEIYATAVFAVDYLTRENDPYSQ